LLLLLLVVVLLLNVGMVRGRGHQLWRARWGGGGGASTLGCRPGTSVGGGRLLLLELLLELLRLLLELG
jgi:hypothetical protein